VNREETITIQKEILTNCNGLTEEAIMLVLPNPDSAISHGYQLHIKSKLTETNLPCLKTIAQRHNLALDTSRKGLVIVYRPCFIRYSSQNLLR